MTAFTTLLAKTRSPLRGALTLALVGCISLPAWSAAWQDIKPTREQQLASLNVVELLRRYHYNKPPLDDARSAKIYDSYLKLLDPNRSYFLASDIAGFERYRLRFDELLQQADLQPGFDIYLLHLQRLNERLDFAIDQLQNHFDSFKFDTDATLELDREGAAWANTAAELDDLWRLRLKDEILRLKLAGKDAKGIQELLLKRYQNQLKRLKQTRDEDVFQAYINAFAMTYDPHTQYLSPDNAENFDINMSLSLEGIGAVLQTDNDYVKVVRLVPAGPADKAKQLQPADRIVSVGQGADGELVDVIGWRLDEVVKLIRGPKGSNVRLEIIPARNGANDLTTKTIQITRDAVKLEEQAAKKSILNLTEDGKPVKIGVIEIPAFYMDFKAYREGDANYKSTTRDVKRLLKELQADKIDGLVIDLRNNGGGSLQEANELTGLFIGQGPTVLVRNSDGRVDVMSDDRSQPMYQGPMAVLVNRLSASASEIFAGAMQDYHRALIVGGQTFGKGTVQTVQPLNHGELKLTLAKFYRVSGKSTQHQGVIPDVSYPSVVDVKEIGESALPEALPYDSIKPAIEVSKNLYAPYLQQLNDRHLLRAANDPDFVFTRDNLLLAQKLAKETHLTLNEKGRRAFKDQVEQQRLVLENTRRKAKGEELLSKLDDEELDGEDETPHEAEKTKPEDDAYLVESGRVLADFLTLQQRVAKQ
ncbi:carboxy terminal-processing peptidase [Atopomonas sediminilitoris]|uniref:carboxy terminal-processing peptidase n=1 Tax=Atopomonas sediminilitoris TaxID=2919919 RepID=UPI001F4EB74E|nr:carboxy terminal-processing peptidase [Atopomonas sediminilitoris]MCJ8170091.1 carboxy terminal-processing peptidase [Atopomonas sediminilitoris]